MWCWIGAGLVLLILLLCAVGVYIINRQQREAEEIITGIKYKKAEKGRWIW